MAAWVEVEVKAVRNLCLGSGSCEDVEQRHPLQLHRLELGRQALEAVPPWVVPPRVVPAAHR